jgi:hypothetical protein
VVTLAAISLSLAATLRIKKKKLKRSIAATLKKNKNKIKKINSGYLELPLMI